MIKTLVILPDGSQLSSGAEGAAIETFTLTQSVNAGEELTLGSVCSAMVELTVLSPRELDLHTSDPVTVYRCCGEERHKIGVFLAQEPVRLGANRLKITAYDRVSLLDQDLTQWLEAQLDWPCTLQTLSRRVCEQCGVTLKEEALPNGSYSIQKFRVGQVTGRQIMQWIGELCGRFCRADAHGNLEFAWYTPIDCSIAPEGENYYFQNSLNYRQYTVTPIEKVQLRQNQEDVGTVYPDNPGSVNTYCITGNPLVSADSAKSLIGIAQTLYEQLRNVTYTPCKVTVAAGFTVSAGDILTVRGADGAVLTVYVMTRIQSGDRDTLEATGSPCRAISAVANHNSLKDLSGKVLNLTTTVDGLRAENRDAEGRLASLQLDVTGITSEVSRQQADSQSVKKQLTALSQKADSVEIRVQKLTQTGTARVQTEAGFTFDDRGLTISKGDSQIENLLDETGMYIKRHGNVILQANQDGVGAVDVTVRNFLVIGEHARLEDYSSGTDEKRTACYWI